MSRLKDTTTKGKQNRSLAKSGGADREAKEAALRALEKLGYNKVSTGAAGEIEETGSYDKDTLVGVPFVIVNCEHKESKTYPDGTYVIVTFLLPDNSTGVFADGGVGIKNQLAGVQIDITDPSTFVRINGGLRKSEYTNQYGAGATFYLAAKPGKEKSQARRAQLIAMANGARA